MVEVRASAIDAKMVVDALGPLVGAPWTASPTVGATVASRPGHGKSTDPEFGSPIGWKSSPRMGVVNHLSIPNTRWRNVWTNDHSPSTD